MSLSSSLRALQIRRSRLCGPRCNALHALAEATSLPEYPSLALILVEGVRGCLVHLPGPSLAPLPPWGTGGSVAAPGRHREGPGRGESRPPYQGQPPPSLRHGGWSWPASMNFYNPQPCKGHITVVGDQTGYLMFVR